MKNTELHEQFFTAARLMRPSRQPGRGPHGEHGPAADPTRGQGRILATLKLQDGIPTRELAFILGMRVASLNEALGKLEKAGFISREASETDKRIMLIRLTDAGRETEQFTPKSSDAFAVLSDEERAQLSDMLTRIIDSLREQHPERAAEYEQWREKARERMGDEQFEHWMRHMESRGPEFDYRGGHRGGERDGRGDHDGRSERRGGGRSDGERHGRGGRGHGDEHTHERGFGGRGFAPRGFDLDAYDATPSRERTGRLGHRDGWQHRHHPAR